MHRQFRWLYFAIFTNRIGPWVRLIEGKLYEKIPHAEIDYSQSPRICCLPPTTVFLDNTERLEINENIIYLWQNRNYSMVLPYIYGLIGG